MAKKGQGLSENEVKDALKALGDSRTLFFERTGLNMEYEWFTTVSTPVFRSKALRSWEFV